MDLINSIPTKKNTQIRVNGTLYQIDGDGICRGVNETDATKLLQNADAWRPWSGKAGTVASKPLPAMGLIGSNGEVVPKDETRPDLDAPVRAAHDQFEANKAGEANPPPSSTEETKWGVPGEGEEWPDPVEDMPITYLRQMADAYDVKYKSKTNKKDLIKSITAEMYPDK